VNKKVLYMKRSLRRSGSIVAECKRVELEDVRKRFRKLALKHGEGR